MPALTSDMPASDTHAVSPASPASPVGFDENAPAAGDSGLYGLPRQWPNAHVVVIPVPFEATVSYGAGTADGPEAILAASAQVDLYDGDVGSIYKIGISMHEEPEDLRDVNDHAREAACRAIDTQTNGSDVNDPEIKAALQADLATVYAASQHMNDYVKTSVQSALDEGKLPVVLGGDHSVAYGSIVTAAKAVFPKTLTVVHFDAHADLRDAYEGFVYSHASVMFNVLRDAPNVRLIQLGIRDFCQAELDVIRANSDRVVTYFDSKLRRIRLSGGWLQFADDVAQLAVRGTVSAESSAESDEGKQVGGLYVSFDIDGLDPALCPNTGTPVPGGLSFDEAISVLEALAHAGKKAGIPVVALDLNEVSPAPVDLDIDVENACEGHEDEHGHVDEDGHEDGHEHEHEHDETCIHEVDLSETWAGDWNANVASRLLYKMIGFAAYTRGLLELPS